MKMLSATASFLLAAAMAAAMTTTASAGCHLIDCVDNIDIKPDEIKAMSCDELWLLRNSIYDDAGFCFASPKAAEHFSNQGCTYTDERLVPLNDYQRSNIQVFRGMEAKKGCK